MNFFTVSGETQCSSTATLPGRAGYLDILGRESVSAKDQRIRELLVPNSHLVEGERFPESYVTFYKHKAHRQCGMAGG